MIESCNNILSIRHQCRLLSVHRSGFYYRPEARAEDTELANEIHEIWHEMPFYGYRRITAEVNRRGFIVNHKRVRRVMHECGIAALYPRPRTTLRAAENKIYPYLLKDISIIKPNAVWSTDITYIKLPGGFVYLVAIIDVFSRYIVSWRLSNSLDISFCLEMLESALECGLPGIINTDQRSQFTSMKWVEEVESHGIKVSMDGIGRWADNITIERFWRTVKHENLRYTLPETMPELRNELTRFITMYNERRLHQSLNYQTPQEVYYEKKNLKAA